ncbi:hypothetical protein D3C72_1798270 [compost metagenome]
MAGMWVILAELALRESHHIAGMVEQDGPRAAGALVERQHILRLGGKLGRCRALGLRGWLVHAFNPDNDKARRPGRRMDS